MTDQDIQGTVTDSNGDPVQGAQVLLFLSDDSDSVVETTTDSNGDYVFNSHPDGSGAQQEWHVAVSYTEGGGTFNSISKPQVKAKLSQ